MFLDINEFVEEPKYFPVVVIQPNAQDFIVGMDCNGTSVFKCITREVHEDGEQFKDFIQGLYVALEYKILKMQLHPAVIS